MTAIELLCWKKLKDAFWFKKCTLSRQVHDFLGQTHIDKQLITWLQEVTLHRDQVDGRFLQGGGGRGDCIESLEVLGTWILRTVCTKQPLVVGSNLVQFWSSLCHHCYCYQNHFVWSQDRFLYLNLLRLKCHSNCLFVGK